MSKIASPELAVRPTLKTVTLKPDAIPRRLGGTDPIIEEMFGDTNIPLPTPSSPREIEIWR